MAAPASSTMDAITKSALTTIAKKHFALHAEPWNTLTTEDTSLPSKIATALDSALRQFPIVHTNNAFNNPLLTSTVYLSPDAISIPQGTDLPKLISKHTQSSAFDPADTSARNTLPLAIARSKLFAAGVATLVAFLRRLAEQPYVIWTVRTVQIEFLHFLTGGAHKRASEVVEVSTLFATSFLTQYDPIIELLARAARASGRTERAVTAEEGHLDRIEDYMICPAVRRPDMAPGGFRIVPLM